MSTALGITRVPGRSQLRAVWWLTAVNRLREVGAASTMRSTGGQCRVVIRGNTPERSSSGCRLLLCTTS